MAQARSPSFAEGLEILVTGALRRWQELTSAWQQGWHNLHSLDQARIEAEFYLSDVGVATLTRTWPTGTDLASSVATVQVAGEKVAGLDRLGWSGPLSTYRPFLAHSELEAFLKGPSHLYDLLASVLGLEDLSAAEKLLAAERKARQDTVKNVDSELVPLLGKLETLEDERAENVGRHLLAVRAT